jgi:hypothetical protein
MGQEQQRRTMYAVYIRFIDGATLRFRAREFNINVVGRLPPEQKPKRFTYTDTNGQHTPIYLSSTRLPRSW